VAGLREELEIVERILAPAPQGSHVIHFYQAWVMPASPTSEAA